VIDALGVQSFERPAVVAVAKDEVTLADAGPVGADEAARLAADDDLGEAGPEDRSPSVDADLDASAVHRPCDPTTMEASSANDINPVRSFS
jgi:hypothetical protein